MFALVLSLYFVLWTTVTHNVCPQKYGVDIKQYLAWHHVKLIVWVYDRSHPVMMMYCVSGELCKSILASYDFFSLGE